MASIIAITNQKGGVGKTKMAVCIAGAFAEAGKSILLVDLDQQGNLTETFFDNKDTIKPSVNDLLVDNPELDTAQIIRNSGIEKIDVLPGNIALRNLDARTAGESDAQMYLDDALEPVRDRYDFIIIDCPPSLGMAVRMACVAAQNVIIPVEPERFAVSGTRRVIEFVDQVKRRVNPDLSVMGLVLNKINATRRLDRKYVELIRNAYTDLVFTTEFKNQAEYARVTAARMPVTHFAPKTESAQLYRNFVQEVFHRSGVKSYAI